MRQLDEAIPQYCRHRLPECDNLSSVGMDLRVICYPLDSSHISQTMCLQLLPAGIFLAQRRRRKNKRPKYDGILDPRVGTGTAVHRVPTKKSGTWEAPRSPRLLNEPVITVVPPYKNEKPSRRRPVILLERSTTCKACGTGLPVGSPAKRYPNGVFGQDCHTRKR
jgi:hypothetical protein